MSIKDDDLLEGEERLLKNLKVVKRFTWTVAADKGNVKIIYLDTLWFKTFFAFLIGYLIAFALINPIPFGEQYRLFYTSYEKPVAFLIEPIFHIWNWFLFLLSFIYKPLGYTFVDNQLALIKEGQAGFYLLKSYLSLSIGFVVASSTYKKFVDNPVIPNKEEIKRGMGILFFDKAAEYYNNLFAKNAKPNDVAFILGGMKITWKKLSTHMMIIGASGTGKTQAIIKFIAKLINWAIKTNSGRIIKNPVRLTILDPKNEFTPKFYDENNPAHVLIDLTDERSHSIDYRRDLSTPALIKRLATSIIPAGKDPTWTNTPQNFLMALFLFMQDNFGSYTEREIEDLYLNAGWAELEWIVNRYYPLAKDFLPPKRADGTYDEAANPNASYRSTAHNYIGEFIELGHYVKKAKKFFSVREFMLNPKCPHKIVFIRINTEGGNAAQTLARSVLSAMSGYIDSNEMPLSKSPKHVFLFEEIAGAGKLVDENGMPILDRLLERSRAKGGCVITIMQDLLQIRDVYDGNEKIIEKWLANSSTHIYAGFNRGEGADKLSEKMGKVTVGKITQNPTYDKDMKKERYGDKNIQSEEKSAITSSELVEVLGARNGHINVLVDGVNISNILIVKQPFVTIPDKPLNNNHPARILKHYEIPKTSEVIRLVKELMAEEKKSNKDDMLNKLQNGEINIENMDVKQIEETKILLDLQQKKNIDNAKKIKIDEEEELKVDLSMEVIERREDYAKDAVKQKVAKRADDFIAEYLKFKENLSPEFRKGFLSSFGNLLLKTESIPSHYKLDISVALRKNTKLSASIALKIIDLLDENDIEVAYVVNSLM